MQLYLCWENFGVEKCSGANPELWRSSTAAQPPNAHRGTDIKSNIWHNKNVWDNSVGYMLPILELYQSLYTVVMYNRNMVPYVAYVTYGTSVSLH